MKVFIFIFIFIFMLETWSMSAFGDDSTYCLLKSSEKEKLVVGKFYSLDLQVINYKTIDYKNIGKIKGKKFLDIFYVTRVVNISVSSNNADVLDIKLEVIPVKEIEQSDSFVWKYKETNIPVKFKNILIINDIEALKEFHIFDLIPKRLVALKKAGVGIITFSIILLIFFIVKKTLNLLKLKAKRARSKKRKKLVVSQMKQAQTRQDFIRILKKESYINNVLNTKYEFFEYMNVYRYKKNYLDDEKDMIKKLLSVIIIELEENSNAILK